MPTFALSGKYTAEALAAVREAGFVSREPQMQAVVEQMGGKFLAVYWPASPDWDFVVLCDLPNADAAYAMVSFSNASGTFLKTQAVQLRTSAEADSAIAPQVEWTPPGS